MRQIIASKMASTTFGTVLVARSKDQPATPLEQSLRTCSQRLRVVPRLSGEAHFIVKEEGSSLAFQLYDSVRIDEIERRWKEEAAAAAGRHGHGGGGRGGRGGRGGEGRIVSGEDWMLTKEAASKRRSSSNNNNNNKNFNPLKDDATILGTQTFRDTFRNTAIFFVLGPPHSDLRRRQMTRPTSFLNVMQRALASPRTGSAGGSNENGGVNSNSNADDNNGTAPTATAGMGSSRIFLVTDVASLQSHLRTTIDSIRPDKLRMKEKFFAEQCRLNLLPPPSKTNLSPSSSASGSALEPSSSSSVEIDNNVAAQRVADALRAWSDGVGIPRGEMDVVMSMLGSLEAVVTAGASSLANVPVSNRSKQMIVAFFSSPLSAAGVGNEEEQRDDGTVAEEMEELDQPTHNFSTAGGWTAGGESGMGFPGCVAANDSGGGDMIPGMQSVGRGSQSFSNHPAPNNMGEAEGPRQFHMQNYHQHNRTVGVRPAYGELGYYNGNIWGGEQQPAPPFNGSNSGGLPGGWM